MRAIGRAVLAYAAAALRLMPELFGLRDIFMFGGLACAARGAFLVYEPAAWLLVGLVLMLLALRARRPE